MFRKEYRHGGIVRAAGVSKMQLSHWVTNGAIIPLKREGGRGGRSVYSFQNLAEAMIAGELAGYHCDVEVIKHALSSLRGEMKTHSNLWEDLQSEGFPEQLFLLIRRWKEDGEEHGQITTFWGLNHQEMGEKLSLVSSVLIINLGAILERASPG